MAYSAPDIEEAFRCAGFRRRTTGQEFYGRVMAHLEGRCQCLADRCPFCDERMRNGELTHKLDCPVLYVQGAKKGASHER